jgi:hypothetical protein
VREHWGTAIDLLKVLRVISLDIGARYRRQVDSDTAKPQDFVFEVLTKLHANACLVTAEIVALLENGYASGAYARWRTLHETAVIATLISENGQDLAERFLEYDVIESWKAASEYQKQFEANRAAFEAGGFRPVSKEDLDHLTTLKNDRCARFGEKFCSKTSYGWAAQIFGDKVPTFAQIEEKTGFVHLRPFYKLSCYSVHAEPKLAYFNMGLSPTRRGTLVGPSVFGLADPGQDAALSLYQITALLLAKQTVFNTMLLFALEQMVEETKNAFAAAHRVLEPESA